MKVRWRWMGGFLVSALFAGPPEPVARAADLVNQGKLRSAEALLQPLVAAPPPDPDALFWLGKIARQNRRDKDALALYEQAMLRSDLAEEYVTEFMETHAAVIRKSRPAEATALWQGMVATLKSAVSRHPDSLKLRLTLIEIYARTPAELGGNLEPAIAEARGLVKWDPYQARMYLGSLLANHGRLAEARAEFTAAISLQPDDVAARVRLGSLLQAVGDFAGAYAVYQEVLQREPANLVALYQLGRVAALSAKYSEEGLASLARFLADPAKEKPNSDAAAHWRMGKIHENKRDFLLARQCYERALRADTRFTQARASLAQLGAHPAGPP